MEDDEEEEITAATLRGRPRPPPISAQSAFSYVPPRRQDPKEHSYYYRESKVRGGVGSRQGPDRGGRAGPEGMGTWPQCAEAWGRCCISGLGLCGSVPCWVDREFSHRGHQSKVDPTPSQRGRAAVEPGVGYADQGPGIGEQGVRSTRGASDGVSEPFEVS